LHFSFEAAAKGIQNMKSKPSQRFRSLCAVIALGAALLLSGCQSMVKKPVIHVEGITYANITKTAQTVGVNLNVKNPNPFAIPIQSGRANVLIDGQQFAQGAILHPITLPAYGDVRVTVPIHTNTSVLEDDLPTILLDDGIQYRVVGQVIVGSFGSKYPFAYQGRLTWKEIRRMIAHTESGVATPSGATLADR
ncbi:MAG: LEA type 2 family protein, partial [Acidithiobacillus sp.]